MGAGVKPSTILAILVALRPALSAACSSVVGSPLPGGCDAGECDCRSPEICLADAPADAGLD